MDLLFGRCWVGVELEVVVFLAIGSFLARKEKLSVDEALAIVLLKLGSVVLAEVFSMEAALVSFVKAGC